MGYETCEVGAGNPAARQSKRREGAVLVGRKGGEYYFIDSVFYENADMFGCTGTMVRVVSTKEADEALEPDRVAERYDDAWEEYADNPMLPSCRECEALGVNEDGCANCGYQSLSGYCADLVQAHGCRAMFDVVSLEYEDALRELPGIDDRMELADCSGCGRIFGDADDFDDVYNRKALVACLAYEAGAVSFEYARKVIYGD